MLRNTFLKGLMGVTMLLGSAGIAGAAEKCCAAADCKCIGEKCDCCKDAKQTSCCCNTKPCCEGKSCKK